GARTASASGGSVCSGGGAAPPAAWGGGGGSFRLVPGRPRPDPATTTVGPGVLLGELALLTETVRPATATASEPSSVIRIPRKLFLKMLEGYPDAAHRLREVIAARANKAMNDIASMRRTFDVADKSR